MEDSDRSLTNTTDISYGSKVLAKLEAGQSATLRCARKRMKADITVTAGVGSGGGKSMSANAFAADLAVARVTVERPNFTSSVIVEVTE